MRNHGRSGWADDVNYPLMAADIDNYLEERGVKKNEKIVLVGHSMGGKVAMTFACMWPKRVTGLVSLD